MFDVSTVMSTVTEWLQRPTPGDWVDIGCLAIAITGILIGAFRGLSGELPIGMGWVCGLVVGWYAYHPTRTFFHQAEWFQGHPQRADAVALVVVGLMILGVSALVRHLIGRLAKAVAKQPLDALLGAVAGAFRVALLLFLVTTALLLLPWPGGRTTVCHDSRTGCFIAPYATDVVISVRAVFCRSTLHGPPADAADPAAKPAAR